jgi:hypothetical protein
MFVNEFCLTDQVAASPNNSLCAVGIAYNAQIGGIRMLDGQGVFCQDQCPESFEKCLKRKSRLGFGQDLEYFLQIPTIIFVFRRQ